MSNTEIDILGACTIRDTFEMCLDIKDRYKVNIFIQNNPPTTLGYDKLYKTIGLKFNYTSFKKTPKCWFKWFSINAEEQLFDILTKTKSKFVIVNLCECSYPFYEIQNNNGTTRLCTQLGIKENNIFKNFPQYTKIIDPLTLDIHSVLNDIDNFSIKLKNLYEEKNIILLENYPAEFYINKNNNTFLPFEDHKKYIERNIFLEKLYYRFIENVQNCNIVQLPKNSIGDALHKWGACNQHYVQDVYDYLGYAFDRIIQNNLQVFLHASSLSLGDYNRLIVRYKNLKITFYDIIKKYESNKNPFEKFCERYAILRIIVKSSSLEKQSFIVQSVFPSPLTKTTPSWLQKNGYGVMFTSYAGEIFIKIKVQTDQEITIYLQGVDARDVSNERYPVKIDIKELLINNVHILNTKTTVWHDNPFIYKQKYEMNDILNIRAIWYPYKYF